MEPTAIKVYGPEGKTAEIFNSQEELDRWAEIGYRPKAEDVPASVTSLNLNPPATESAEGTVSLNLSVSGQAPDPAAANPAPSESGETVPPTAPVAAPEAVPPEPAPAASAPAKKSGQKG